MAAAPGRPLVSHVTDAHRDCPRRFRRWLRAEEFRSASMIWTRSSPRRPRHAVGQGGTGTPLAGGSGPSGSPSRRRRTDRTSTRKRVRGVFPLGDAEENGPVAQAKRTTNRSTRVIPFASDARPGRSGTESGEAGPAAERLFMLKNGPPGRGGWYRGGALAEIRVSQNAVPCGGRPGGQRRPEQVGPAQGCGRRRREPERRGVDHEAVARTQAERHRTARLAVLRSLLVAGRSRTCLDAARRGSRA